MKSFVLIACSAVLLAACVREAENIPPVTGGEVEVCLKWSVAGIAAGDDMTAAAAATAAAAKGQNTRVIPPDMGPGGIYDDGYPSIQNMWIIQFDGLSPTARMLGAPRFLSVADGDLGVNDPQDQGGYPLSISIPLIEVTVPCYTLFVANIRQGSTYNWNLSSESTFAEVITRVKTISGESGTFEDFTLLPDGGHTLLMSAVTTGKVMFGTPLEPVFTRNVAKVTLNLSLDNPDMSIASVRMRNVSNRIVFADAALPHNGVTASTVFPVDAATIDYNPITDQSLMPAHGETATFSWYVPRNQQGTNPLSTSAREKTFFAPANATFIEIVAVKNGSDIATSIFRIYPGPNMTDDFNLTSNHEYTVGLNVVDIGTDPADSRVQTFSKVVNYSGPGTPASRSNSFIINPSPVAEGGDRTYLIGIDQVNRYWGGTAAGYGNDPLYVINEGETWVVNLIWSDLPELFSIGPSATAITLVNNNGSVVGGGTGPNEVFALNVPPNLPAGNFLLGIRKVNGNQSYLWSWHFWVTDYAPDNFNRALIDHDTYTYVVPGGQVERLAPGVTGSNNDLLWTNTGFYADKVMMDRNLGAVENFFSTQFAFTSRGMLHYQFGRKDPFPGRIAYTTDPSSGFTPDATSGVAIASGPISITESVGYPWVFSGVNGNWTTDANATTYLWNDPNITSFEAGKSIYDPCPPGWKLPLTGTWNDFARTVDSRLVTVLNQGRDLAYTFGRGIGSADAAINGLRYWPGTALDSPVRGRIWYPAMGGRTGTGGTANAIGTAANYWMASPLTTSHAAYLNSGSASVEAQRSSVRSSAFPLRCITE